jgi:hypothetical protein
MARNAHAFVLLFSTLALANCQTVTEEPGQSPTTQPLPTLSVPVVITAVATPIPAVTPPAAPTPTPAPGTDPTPAPTPTPPTTSQPGHCSPGGGSGGGNQCRKEAPQFLDDVTAAVDDVVAQNPQMFDLADMKGEKGYKILDPSAFQDKVAMRLRQKGYCAQVDNYEEIGVKMDNSFAESYDIVLSTNHIRRGQSSYEVTCRPPWF